MARKGPLSAADGKSVDEDFDDDGDWVGTTTACSMLALSPRELYRVINEGRLPAYKFGRVIRMRRRDVERFGTT